MAISYTHKGIEFNIKNEGLNPLGGLYGRLTESQWNRVANGTKTTIEPFINAVEIDWNGAKLGDTIIKMIGESILFNSCSALLYCKCHYISIEK